MMPLQPTEGFTVRAQPRVGKEIGAIHQRCYRITVHDGAVEIVAKSNRQ